MNKLAYLVFLLCIMFVSCKTVQYVPVEKIKTEYIHSVDSIHTTDSIWIESKVIHDTVHYTQYKYRQIEVIKRDTVLKVDTIPVIKEVERIVEVNKQKKWQIALEYIGGVVSLLLTIFIGFKIKKFIKI